MSLKLFVSLLIPSLFVAFAQAQTDAAAAPKAEAKKEKATTEKPADKQKEKSPEGIEEVKGEYFTNIDAVIPGNPGKLPYRQRVQAAKKVADEKCKLWGYKGSDAFYYERTKGQMQLTDAFCSNEKKNPRLSRIALLKDRASRGKNLNPPERKLVNKYNKLTIKGFKKTDIAGEGSGTKVEEKTAYGSEGKQ
ncbi:MAG: hypothetical protein KF789_02620 [Bdellovibrionaceae bacterium]|nr:hypothetical protein [Pseudobdellovibrionaceae bacterium]